jgi:hypothetical protein
VLKRSHKNSHNLNEPFRRKGFLLDTQSTEHSLAHGDHVMHKILGLILQPMSSRVARRAETCAAIRVCMSKFREFLLLKEIAPRRRAAMCVCVRGVCVFLAAF